MAPRKDSSGVRGRTGIWEVSKEAAAGCGWEEVRGSRASAETQGPEGRGGRLCPSHASRLPEAGPGAREEGAGLQATSPHSGLRPISLPGCHGWQGSAPLLSEVGSGCLACHSHLCPPAPGSCLPALLPHAAPSPFAPTDHALMCADLSWGTTEPGEAENVTHPESSAGEAGRKDATFGAHPRLPQPPSGSPAR